MILPRASVAIVDESRHVPGTSQVPGTSSDDFWENYQAFCAAYDLDSFDLGPELFADIRDRSPGPETIQFDSPTENHP
jgi:hypothetical protein